MADNAAKAKPLMRHRIRALLDQVGRDGCTPGEASAAYDKAEELVAKHGFDRAEFTWPERPAACANSKPEPKGVGRLARELLLKHRDWSHQRIADEVNSTLGSKASAASVAWYAAKMRKEGLEVSRVRNAEEMAH
jgi:hypothetical protein